MTTKRLIEMIDGVLAWGADHNAEFRECLVDALGITEEEYSEMFDGEKLNEYLGIEEEDEEEEEDIDLPEEDWIHRPSNLETDDDFEEYISNYLSDEYGLLR